MINVQNLEEIYAHLEAHPATAVYSTCPCGTEIHSYTGWIEHAVIPLVTDAIVAGYSAGSRQAPFVMPTDTEIPDEMPTEDDEEVIDIIDDMILEGDIVE